MRWRAALAAVAGLLAAGTLPAQEDAAAVAVSSVDAQRSAWGYRRKVSVPSAAELAALPIPPELAARAQPDLRDLRLVDSEGRDVAFVVDRLVEASAQRTWTGRLIDTRREPIGPAHEGRGRSTWVMDLGASRRFDTVTLLVPTSDFVKRVRLEASDDAGNWSLLRDDAGVFDAPWGIRVHHTEIALEAPATARYLRVGALDDRRSAPIDLTGVVVALNRRRPEELWTRPVPLERIDGESSPDTGRTSRYRLGLPGGFPVETLRLAADDPAFARHVVLREVREVNGQNQERVLADATLYRLRLKDEALAGDCLDLRLTAAPEGGALSLEVRDGDSPPLRNLRAVASAKATRLLFPAPELPVVLYYGNPVTRAPLFDLDALRARLGLSEELAAATLGPEATNPAFRRAPPLPFAAARGAVLDVRRWRSRRVVPVTGGDDIYTFTLAAGDLDRLRPDLGDVRLVDEEDRQVPYILEAGAAEDHVAFSVSPQTGPAPRDAGSVSRHALSLVAPESGEPLRLPVSGVELKIAEEFFDRPARLVAPAPAGARGDRTVFSGRLTRRGGTEHDGEPTTILLPLGGSRVDTLRLEIDEGDNAPLNLLEADALVRVPRLAFKAGSGTYRLLLGEREATAPRYDLASLRREVLAYSATVVTPAPAEPNPAYRRLFADYFEQAPPTLLLWGALLVAVVGLVFLTARILKSTASDDLP